MLVLVLKFGLVGGGGAYIHARRRAGSGPTFDAPLLDFEAVEPAGYFGHVAPALDLSFAGARCGALA